VDTRNRSAAQRALDNTFLLQQRPQPNEQHHDERPLEHHLSSHRNMSNTNEFPARILVKGMKPPEQFTGTEDQDISVWLQDFEETVDAAGGDSTTKRKAIVLHLSGDAKKRYRLSDVESDDRSTFRAKLIAAFTSDSQQLKAMTKLMNRKQGINESVQSYFYDLLALCSKFNPRMHDSEKILHLLRGVKPSLARSIVMFNPTTIKEFLELAKRSETALTGVSSLMTTTTEESEITALLDGETDLERMAAISRRGGHSTPRTSRVPNNYLQAQESSSAIHMYPTDRKHTSPTTVQSGTSISKYTSTTTQLQ
jgi:hypothetical protein